MGGLLRAICAGMCAEKHTTFLTLFRGQVPGKPFFSQGPLPLVEGYTPLYPHSLPPFHLPPRHDSLEHAQLFVGQVL